LKTLFHHRILSALVVLTVAISAGVQAGERTPYTESDLEAAVPMGIPAVRTWADAPLSVLAPLAFLGSAYDQRLKALYTEMSMHRVLSGSPVMGLFGEGLYNTRPMQRIVARQIDQTVLADIAAAHRQGRRLFVVTTEPGRTEAGPPEHGSNRQ
jgi:hypothetical protein